MGEVILFTSGKGGVGKTSLVASAGAQLADSDKKVLVIDMDFGLRNLDIITGLENFIFNNAFDAIKGKCKIDEAVIESKNIKGLYVLSAPQTKGADSITKDEFSSFIKNLKEEYDYILIDSPSGIGQGFYNLTNSADKVIVITTPEVMSVRDADKVISILKSERIFNINLLVNRLRTDIDEKYNLMSVEDIKEIIPADIIGIIPEDKEAYISINHGETFNKINSDAGICLRKMVSRIKGEDIPLTSFGHSEGFFKRFSHIFKRKGNKNIL